MMTTLVFMHTGNYGHDRENNIVNTSYSLAKDEISYPDSFIMVRLTRPSNFKFPGLISLSVFLRKLGLFSLI